MSAVLPATHATQGTSATHTPQALNDFIAQALSRPDNAWSMGTLGALAEFAALPQAATTQPDPGTARNAGGAIRITLPAQVRVIAEETLSANPGRWQQRVTFSLPAADEAAPSRSTLTELGTDDAALRNRDRAALLFDLGIGIVGCEFLVRTQDLALIDALRQACGQPLFGAAAKTSALAAVAAAHPHRIVRSPLGRIEVYQPIPPPDGRSPDGPHTHLLPALLARRQQRSSATPTSLKEDAPLALHPAPAINEKGFDATAFAAFQSLLATFGDQTAIEIKRRVWTAVRAGEMPAAFALATPVEHRICRVALRQLAQRDGDSPTLARWRERFEPPLRRGADVHAMADSPH